MGFSLLFFLNGSLEAVGEVAEDEAVVVVSEDKTDGDLARELLACWRSEKGIGGLLEEERGATLAHLATTWQTRYA